MFSQFKDRVARRNKTDRAQSTTQHNRLSKPRTNTNSNSNSKSPSPVVNNDIPHPDPLQGVDLSAKGRQQIRDSMLSPTSKDSGSAVWSDQDVLDTETVVDRRGRRSTVISRSNSRAHSRSGSVFFRSRHNSTANLKSPQDSKVSLVSTTQSDVEAAIRLLQEVKKNASPEELAALREALERPTESTAAPEQEFDRSSPEISGALIRKKSLVQTPGVATRITPVEGKRRTWNSWKAPQTKQEDEAKWRTPKQGASPLDRLVALDLAENSRPQTPGEMDYSPLGTFKPGSLKVVNGAASPAPSTINLLRIAQANKNNDYFSTAEPDPSPLAMNNNKGPTPARSRSSVGLSDSKIRSKPDPASEEKIAITYTKPQISIATSTRRPSQSADTLAKDYQTYIPYSPFENRMVIHNIWQDQEATTDELFLEDLQPRPCQDGHVELSATITDVTELSPPSTVTSTNHLEAPKNRMLEQPSPSTSDSGYSSVRSSRGSLQAVKSEQYPSALRVAVPVSNKSPRARFSANRAQTMSFELPAHDDRPARFEQSLLSTVPTHAHGRTLSLDIPRAVAELPSMDLILAPSTPQSATSKDSEKPTSKLTKRLHKRRPSQPSLVVQSAQPSQDIIPEVPDDVRVKFSRRLSATPGMECLTHTYPSKDHVATAESTAIFSPIEPVSSPIQLEPDHVPAPLGRGRRKSMSFFRRKSVTGKEGNDQQENIPSPKVLDLGTIAGALGASPYDPAMFGTPEREAVENPTHPHQLGEARSRSKSRMSMSSDTAVEWARMRSKDRALPEPEMPEMPQQQKSRRKPRMEIGEAKKSKRRPQTFDSDEAPPMPTIDHSKYSIPLSANPRLETAGTPTANQSRTRTSSRPQSPPRPNHTQAPSAHKNVDWEQHALQWKQRRQTIGDSLRPQPKKENTAPAPKSRPMSYTSQELTVFGRYGGGLDYDHEGRGQIGGSAGTRQLHSYSRPKSMHFKQSYGVDLSDVPIFIQRQ